jgi:hypothetical protein
MTTALPDPLAQLREDFRQQLEQFYAGLKLAPPYDSVEKAITKLIADLKARSLDEQRRVWSDPSARWQAYKAAFVASGLHLKHRGIIAGMARQGAASGLPPEHRAFLDAYLSATS